MYAKKLQNMGAQNVLVSLGSNGAILVDEYKNIYEMNAINTDKKVSTVGAGDSMVAGFIAGYRQFKNYSQAFKLAVASATATSCSKFLATREEIFECFNDYFIV
jgi:1-phosphofructokinase